MQTQKEKTREQLLGEKLLYQVKNCWDGAGEDERRGIADFAEDYKKALDGGKTEWLFVEQRIAALQSAGFVPLEDALAAGALARPGAKVYHAFNGKSLLCAVTGKRPLDEGINCIGAHIDSPRLDLKTNPLYEDTELALLDTRYYGGIKNYQWLAIPLALYGRLIRQDGEQIIIRAGENETDPAFTITDLLPHLAREQMKKSASEFIPAEELDILAGSVPYGPCEDEKAENRVKLNLLNILFETYGITERDFAAASFSLVPAFKARDIGFDRGMIGGYGHDDRSCSYAAFRALLAAAGKAAPERTGVLFLCDEEECGVTDVQARHFKNFLHILSEKASSAGTLRQTLSRSRMLSADVNAAYDPNHGGVYDKKNASYAGKGLAISKSTTGYFAPPRFCYRLQRMLDERKIRWQFGDMGKVGAGGGGTIARDFAALGMDVIDCGIPVLSMHSPFEVISKIDLWTAYQAFTAFFESAE